MPNLKYDPQNPSDLLGQPIKAGDIVAWGTTFERSPALCIAEIHSIRFITKPYGYGNSVEVPQAQATEYQLRLLPIHSTGGVTYEDKLGEKSAWAIRASDVRDDPDRFSVKITHVKNVVKLNLTPDEVRALAADADDD